MGYETADVQGAIKPSSKDWRSCLSEFVPDEVTSVIMKQFHQLIKALNVNN